MWLGNDRSHSGKQKKTLACMPFVCLLVADNKQQLSHNFSLRRFHKQHAAAEYAPAQCRAHGALIAALQSSCNLSAESVDCVPCCPDRRFTGDRVRLGLLLEDFDTLAGE